MSFLKKEQSLFSNISSATVKLPDEKRRTTQPGRHIYTCLKFVCCISHIKNEKTLKTDSPKGEYTRRKAAGIFNLKKVKTLNMDSPKGEYTRRKGLVILTDIYIYIYIYVYIYVYIYIYIYVYIYIYIYIIYIYIYCYILLFFSMAGVCKLPHVLWYGSGGNQCFWAATLWRLHLNMTFNKFSGSGAETTRKQSSTFLRNCRN